jgi:hypothetical protein
MERPAYYVCEDNKKTDNDDRKQQKASADVK